MTWTTYGGRWVTEDEPRTVVLATNDMGEANELRDRVAILDGGRLVTCDTPAALKDRWHPEPARNLLRARPFTWVKPARRRPRIRVVR